MECLEKLDLLSLVRKDKLNYVQEANDEMSNGIYVVKVVYSFKGTPQ